MNIIFDGRWVRTDFHDGISRYSTGLINGFVENKIPIKVLLHDESQLNVLPDGIDYILANHPVSVKELFIARKLNKLKADVVFSPLQVMGFWGRKYKLILTLQDIIYYKHPKPPTQLPTPIRITWRLFHTTKWPQRTLLNRADHIATVSETSKKFIKDYDLTKKQISVIYNASSLNLQKNELNNKRTKNIIYMGSFMPYKNVEVLIKGMKYLPDEFELHLLSKISNARKNELKKIIAPNKKVIFHNGVSDEKYIELLKNAFCLASGSKEEGFGLPIVEAQQLGTPVICTDMEIFKEVAGEGALFFDPDSPKDFANKVASLNDERITDQLVKKGYAQAEKFSWKKSAKTLHDLYEKIHNSEN